MSMMVGLRTPAVVAAAAASVSGRLTLLSRFGIGTGRHCWHAVGNENARLSKYLCKQVRLLNTSSWMCTENKKNVNLEKSKRIMPSPAPHFRKTLEHKASAERMDREAQDKMSAGVEGNETAEEDGRYLLPHPIWSEQEVMDVEITHRKPSGFVDWFAYGCVSTLRLGFDLLSGYNRGVRSESKWLIRIIFLETIAGVPGMVAAMTRHLRSLRRLQRDHEEAENERMHLMTALELRKPGKLFTIGVLVTQGIFVNVFFVAYLISPSFCHRVVGYLEEEAVITYTKLIKDLDDGKLSVWGAMAAPDLAIRYWNLKSDAGIRDMILAIRADEAHHREVNHSLGSLRPDDDNPFPPGK